MEVISDDVNYVFLTNENRNEYKRFPLNKFYKVDGPFGDEKITQIINYDENDRTFIIQTYLNGYCICDHSSQGNILTYKDIGYVYVKGYNINCKYKDFVYCNLGNSHFNFKELVKDGGFIREYYLFLLQIFKLPIYLLPKDKLRTIQGNLIDSYKALWDEGYRVTEKNNIYHIIKKERIESGEFKMHHLRFDKLNLIYLGEGVITSDKVIF